MFHKNKIVKMRLPTLNAANYSQGQRRPRIELYIKSKSAKLIQFLFKISWFKLKLCCFVSHKKVWNIPLILFDLQRVAVQWMYELHLQRCGGILGELLRKEARMYIFFENHFPSRISVCLRGPQKIGVNKWYLLENKYIFG